MPGLTGSDNPILTENLNSYILSFLDQKSLKAAASVSRDWQAAVTTFQLRMKILDTVLIPSNLYKEIIFHKFDINVLVGGLTNSTVKLTLNKQAYVARLPGTHTDQYISRPNEYINASIVSCIQINPAIYYFHPDTGTQLSEYLTDAKTMTPETIKQPEYLSQAVMVLKSLHQCTKPFSNNINLFQRNRELFQLIERQRGEIDSRYQSIFNTMQIIENITDTLALPTTPCHNDANPGNFLYSQNKMYLIDWEYSGNNLPIWDLVCLAKEGKFSALDQSNLLQSYYEGELNNQIHLFNLLLPVYDLWAALWARIQLTNKNMKIDEIALHDLEKSWLNSCETQLSNTSFMSAVDLFNRDSKLQKTTPCIYQLFHQNSSQQSSSVQELHPLIKRNA